MNEIKQNALYVVKHTQLTSSMVERTRNTQRFRLPFSPPIFWSRALAFYNSDSLAPLSEIRMALLSSANASAARALSVEAADA
jgi:hypothetical protein